jgi:hypothetical protein
MPAPPNKIFLYEIFVKISGLKKPPSWIYKWANYPWFLDMLASCTLQFGSNLTKIIFQGKNFNYFIVVGGWRHVFWSDTHYSISLHYTRNIVQLNSFYIKTIWNIFFIYIINTITNWRVSLSKICHSWPNNIVTHSCTALIRELLCYLVIRDIFW